MRFRSGVWYNQSYDVKCYHTASGVAAPRSFSSVQHNKSAKSSSTVCPSLAIRCAMSQNGPRHVNGFPSLAAFIASDRDYTTLISKRFDRLAARNLLHLQSELARLQRKLDSMDFASTQDIGTESTLRMKQYLRNWDDFILASNDLSAEKERFELVKCIQATLKGYRKLFQSRTYNTREKTYASRRSTAV